MSQVLEPECNFEEESPNQNYIRVQTVCQGDEFQKGKTNIHIDNQVPISLNDKYEIKRSDLNKEMFKDLKGEKMKSMLPSHTSDQIFNEMEHAYYYLDDEFM